METLGSVPECVMGFAGTVKAVGPRTPAERKLLGVVWFLASMRASDGLSSVRGVSTLIEHGPEGSWPIKLKRFRLHL